MKERNSREKKTLTVLNIVNAASGMHIQNSKSEVAHAVEDFRARLPSLGWCADIFQSGHHRAQISKEFFDPAGRGTFVDSVLTEAQWHMAQVENHAR